MLIITTLTVVPKEHTSAEIIFCDLWFASHVTLQLKCWDGSGL